MLDELGAHSSRYCVSGDWQYGTGTALTKITAYGIGSDLDLFSNFSSSSTTRCGVQVEQAAHRFVSGIKMSAIGNRFKWLDRGVTSPGYPRAMSGSWRLQVSATPDVSARLDRIKELWRELERTRRTSPRYEELVGEIHSESLAYQALLTEQYELDRRQAQPDADAKQERDVNRRHSDRRQINRRQK